MLVTPHDAFILAVSCHMSHLAPLTGKTSYLQVGDHVDLSHRQPAERADGHHQRRVPEARAPHLGPAPGAGAHRALHDRQPQGAPALCPFPLS